MLTSGSVVVLVQSMGTLVESAGIIVEPVAILTNSVGGPIHLVSVLVRSASTFMQYVGVWL